MPTMKSQRIEYIDFAKGLAIFLIVLYHYCQPIVSGLWSQVIVLGGSGVHLFLVLSGFGLGLSSNRKIGLFYKKRLTKIILPYYLTIIAIFIFNIFFSIYGDDSLYALGGHLFFYRMIDESLAKSFGYHFWFISTIIQLYIFFPLISLIFDRLSLKLFIFVSFLISCLYWIFIFIYGLNDQSIYSNLFLRYLWEFNLGFALAYLYREKGFLFWNQNQFILLFTSILSFGLMGLMTLKGGQIGRIFNDPFSSLGHFCFSSFIYLTCTTRISPINIFFQNIGSISYELYLIHMFIYRFLSRITENTIVEELNFITIFIALFSSILLSQYFQKTNAFIFRNILSYTRK